MKKHWKITTWNLDIAGTQYKIQYEYYDAFTCLISVIYINGSELILKKHFLFLGWQHEFEIEDHRFLLRSYTKFDSKRFFETDIYGNFLSNVESDLYIDGHLIDPSSIYFPTRKPNRRITK